MLFVCVQDLYDLVRLHSAERVRPHHHHRRQAAGAQAAHRLQREAPVCRRAALLDLEIVLDAADDLLDPFHVAGRSHAHLDPVPTFRLHGEQRVEGGHAEHFAARQVQPFADVVDEFDREVADDVLALPQDGNDRTGDAPVAGDDGVDAGPHGFGDVGMARMRFRDHSGARTP